MERVILVQDNLKSILSCDHKGLVIMFCDLGRLDTNAES
jgi:hypothetical protein